MDWGSATALELLLVEDNPADVRLFEEGLRGTESNHRMHVAMDGIRAMQFLRRQGEYVNAPRPDLVLLDLNLPKKDGRSVLGEVKTDPGLCEIPVVILTTSEADADVRRSYALGASTYLTKPTDLDEYCAMVNDLTHFWGRWARLPGDLG